jgi:hypothetical protein
LTDDAIEIEVDSGLDVLDLDRSMCKGNSPFPDFMTRARRELIPSAAFFAFFGAIVALY